MPLTQGRFAFVSAEDADWALGRRWCVSNGYPARAPQLGVLLYMHREIAVRAGILSGYHDDPRLTDHIDLDHFNNRRDNLRAVDYSLSNVNRHPYTASGLQGVYQHRGRRGQLRSKWHYEARWRGERIRGFGYATPEEAAAARAEAIAQRWPERV